jgi:hypothetical protein
VSKAARLLILAGLLVVAVGLVLFAVFGFVRNRPPTVDFTSGHQSGQPVHITAQTVGTIGYGAHPTWVSYLVKNQQGQWVHSTIWQVPADTTIDVTIQQYDSGSPLRNQQWGSVLGTTGGTATLNGKTYSLIDSNSGNGVGHTFTIPSLGVSVPLPGVNSNAPNICGQAPCDNHSVSNTVSFSFTTPGPGQYPFQCFVPCGLGYLFGNGGPMSTLGYMGGMLRVVS